LVQGETIEVPVDRIITVTSATNAMTGIASRSAIAAGTLSRGERLHIPE
jgi:hypothetical protein